MTEDVQMFWAVKQPDGNLWSHSDGIPIILGEENARIMYGGMLPDYKLVRVEIREVPHDER